MNRRGFMRVGLAVMGGVFVPLGWGRASVHPSAMCRADACYHGVSVVVTDEELERAGPRLRALVRAKMRQAELSLVDHLEGV